MLVDEVAVHGAQLGGHVNRRAGRDGYGDLLTVRSPWGGDGPGILVLSHLDTVHPIGTLADENPFRRDGDKVYGPGIFDMKSGAYLAFYAFQHLVRGGRQTTLPITFMFVPDEEIGSPTTRAEIEAAALMNKYVLVTEPAHAGLCCTGREGVLHADIQVYGHPAHGGSRHQDGRSAIHELAHQIVHLEAMTNYDKGVTVNTGLMSGGSFINVVPAYAEAKVCIRAWDAQTLDTLREMILSLEPIDPDVRIKVNAEINRPIFPRSYDTIKLFCIPRESVRKSALTSMNGRAEAGPTVTSPQRSVCRLWTDWARTAMATIPLMSTSFIRLWNRAPRCGCGCSKLCHYLWRFHLEKIYMRCF